jgi:hypothetical protein
MKRRGFRTRTHDDEDTVDPTEKLTEPTQLQWRVAPPSASEECGGLEALNLSANPELGDSGLITLCQTLPPAFIGTGDLSTLRVLYLENTGAKDEGMAAIAKALQRMTRLEELHLSDNPGVGVEGWAALGGSLPAVKLLRELRASRCRGMGCDGVAALVGKLPLAGNGPEAPSIEELYLDACEIGVEGARALTTVLKRCHELTRLNVRDNPVGAAGRAALETAASKAKPGSKWSWGEGHPRETPLRLSYSETGGGAGQGGGGAGSGAAAAAGALVRSVE